VMASCSSITIDGHLTNSYPKPLLVYCPDMTAEELHSQVEKHSHEYPKGRNFKILIEHEDKFIDLWSIVHFTPNQSKCRKSQLLRTNRFLMHENRWQSNEFLTEPQHNFHGCELRVSIRQDEYPYSNFTENDNGTIETKGLYVEIVKATARSSNLTVYWNAVRARNNSNHKYIENVEDDVNFDLMLMHRPVINDYIIYFKIKFLIPPGVLYSDAEKLFMPLKLEVWIATVATIFIALLVIQIINQLSKQVQNFVFGRNVTTPSLNIMIAFVGGSQTTLPRRNFARFLLMLFIFFSLIIRTCHQSKYFEYLQANFIKSEIQSAEELIEGNYSIYVLNEMPTSSITAQGIKNIVRYDVIDIQEVIERTVDPLFKGAVLIDDLTVAILESQFSSGLTSLKFLRDVQNGDFIYFPKTDQSFINEKLSEIIGRLHSAGLINLWYNEVFKFKNKPADESGPTPLTMDHLTVGFVVSLINLFQ